MALPKFKYFDRPDVFSVFIPAETACDICSQSTRCFDGANFLGNESIVAICPECLASGALKPMDIFTCEGDVEELIRQLHIIHPELTKSAIEKLTREKTEDLDKTTPEIVRWQDWSWPCCEGDYCTFIGFGSRALYNRYAEGNDGEWLFHKSLYYTVKEEGDAEELWAESMPTNAIKNYQASQEFKTLFYVFRSLHSGQIVTVWDAA